MEILKSKIEYKVLLEKQLNEVDLSPSDRLLCFVSTAASINNMDAVAAAIELGIEKSISSQIELYESLLQTYLFAGFPAAIEGLSVLYNYLQSKSNYSITLEYDLHEFLRRGELLCQSVYTTVYDQMRTNMRKISPDLDQWMIIEGYGKTLSRPGLKAKTRELISVSSLAALGWEKQLYSHIRGALNLGATVNECRSLLDGIAILCSKSRYTFATNVFDKVLEGVK
ncbi:MAG: carboxymuconolactone decarboxylase family protein [Ignavibacteria bacterium]|nr:carboxymuconolactone decarboxylase family protein [Ignavibacteria bacterium]